jgi:hypothetical protein
MTDELTKAHLPKVLKKRGQIAHYSLPTMLATFRPGESRVCRWYPERLFRLQWVMFRGLDLSSLTVASVLVHVREQLLEEWLVTRSPTWGDGCPSVVEVGEQLSLEVRSACAQPLDVWIMPLGLTVLHTEAQLDWHKRQDIALRIALGVQLFSREPHASDAGAGLGYPPGWPRCPACGLPVLDGHLTCGRVECDEGGQRR